MSGAHPALVLIGPMGAGKTSIGRRVAKALQVPFYDSDIAVIRDHGPIETIFAEHGEPQFREWEKDAVLAGLAQGGVVALGGGAVLHEQTRAALADHRVVLLTVEPRVVAGRVRDSARPLLRAPAAEPGLPSAPTDPMTRWTEILRARRPVYEAVADVTFDTSHGPLQQVTDAIVAWARDDTTSAPPGQDTTA
ncbi:shikimate kinase [Microbacterium sp. 1P10UB]|uniref:shikimate kinase n=1 Tax=unclassified Microbacterium TaxID=2609290 RepID=UPI0039A06AE4